jgi:hypothetical protein
MMILKSTKLEVEAKTLKIHCKVRDEFTASLVDKDGGTIHDQEDGYVPGFMPGEHYGDYVILDIDLETGRIMNWQQPDASELEEWVNAKSED